jgi:hypothetical protein
MVRTVQPTSPVRRIRGVAVRTCLRRVRGNRLVPGVQAAALRMPDPSRQPWYDQLANLVIRAHSDILLRPSDDVHDQLGPMPTKVSGWRFRKPVVGIIATILVAATAGFLALQCQQGLRPSEVADRLEACIVAQDAACVYRYTGLEERQAYGLTESMVEALLKNYVHSGPGWAEVRRVASGDDPEGRESSRSIRVLGADGKVRPLDIHVVRTAEGSSAPTLITSLIVVTMLWRHAPDETYYKGGSKLAVWAKAIREDAAILKHAGFEGIYRWDTQEMVSWDVYQRHMEARAARYAERNQ